MSWNKTEIVRNSRAYKKARELVTTTVENPKQLLKLIANAQSKAEKSNASGRLSAVMESTKAAIRLLKAYAIGEYRDVSFESLALIVSSIIYFVMPIDLIPDFIVALGFTDDAALLAWTFRSVAEDIERFIGWEQQSDLPDATDHEVD
jgi:uncharacterized membrane protein YkvA (DUF1232 family)